MDLRVRPSRPRRTRRPVLPASLFVEIVQVEEGFSEVELPLSESFDEISDPHQRRVALLEALNDLPGSRHVDRSLIDARQFRRTVSGRQQSGITHAASPFQPQPTPGVELLNAINDRDTRSRGAAERSKITVRQISLASGKRDRIDGPSACLNGWRQSGQQRRFAGAVPPGDFAEPAIGLQQVDELGKVSAVLEDEFDRARPKASGGERVGHHRRSCIPKVP